MRGVQSHREVTRHGQIRAEFGNAYNHNVAPFSAFCRG